MSVTNSITRFARFARKNGLLGALKRSMLHLWHEYIRTSAIVFATDCSAVVRNPSPESGLQLEWFSGNRSLPESLKAEYVAFRSAYQSDRSVARQLARRIVDGSRLWLLMKNQRLAALAWSHRGVPSRPFYLPVTPDEVVVFDIETAPDFRGQGVAGILIELIVHASGEEGISRCFIAAKTWNTASIRAIEKTVFRRLARVRQVRFFGRYFSLVHQL